MREEYKRAYRMIYDDHPWYWDYPPLRIRNIRDLIDKAAAEHSQLPVRIDAKVFLAVNFVYMVSAPLSIEPPRPRTDIEEMLKGDLKTIFKSANEVAEEEITGGDIARSLSQVYDRLKLTSLEVWG